MEPSHLLKHFPSSARHICPSMDHVPPFKHIARVQLFPLLTSLFPPLLCLLSLIPSSVFPSLKNDSKGHFSFNSDFAHPLKFKGLFISCSFHFFLRQELETKIFSNPGFSASPTFYMCSLGKLSRSLSL